jgi:shikimate 5-dehydrogenase
MPRPFSPVTVPTMYFIGVTTGQSSIKHAFPRWAERLGLGEVELRGLDLPLHDRPENYRAAVAFIKNDPLVLGALVTTHKIDLFNACADQFEEIEPLSRSLGEISSIFKRGGRLHARSVDPGTVGQALDAILPRNAWHGGAEALILGAGGAGTALAWHLAVGAGGAAGDRRPGRIHTADRQSVRVDHLRGLHGGWHSDTALECHIVPDAATADALVRRLPAGSLVVNATGAGKDSPGSPVSDAVVFPERGIIWDFNYRGDLRFLEQARAQQERRSLHVEDGWTYFMHGWLHVMSDVFNRVIPTSGTEFDDLGRMAAATRPEVTFRSTWVQ